MGTQGQERSDGLVVSISSLTHAVRRLNILAAEVPHTSGVLTIDTDVDDENNRPSGLRLFHFELLQGLGSLLHYCLCCKAHCYHMLT